MIDKAAIIFPTTKKDKKGKGMAWRQNKTPPRSHATWGDRDDVDQERG